MLWFSLYNNSEYKSDIAAYPDVSQIKGIAELEKNHTLILQELNEYIQANGIQSHFNITMVEKPESWKVRSLVVWGVKMYQYQKHFPKTMELMNQIPGVVNICFNALEPQSKIVPHFGDTNAVIRCHLGLTIPASLPSCGLKVKGLDKNWDPGKVIGFIDAYTHEAWNLTNERRTILLFDILKPEFYSKKNKVCATVLMSFYLQNIGNIFPSLYKMNRSVFKVVLWPFICILQLAIPIRNRLKRKY
ncbi:MAG: aspartyl/asparaginyl beta-hydroxylase domain-containing protein [Bacteroidetes bacterium]|nr:aspartyl/asparaginyl beta-hydroxylase domain-containing protein [Bacteroidota bacterium]